MGNVERCDKTLPLNEMIFYVRKDARLRERWTSDLEGLAREFGLSRAEYEAVRDKDVRRLNEMGVLIDLSHCGRQTAWDAVRASKQPMACTHTFCLAVSHHDRAKPDELLRAVADSGGYVGGVAEPGPRSSPPWP